jgi:hypothetical protein
MTSLLFINLFPYTASARNLSVKIDYRSEEVVVVVVVVVVVYLTTFFQ